MSPSIDTTTSVDHIINGSKALKTANGAKDPKASERFTDARELDVEFARFFGVKPTRVDRRFKLRLTEQTYLPKVSYPSVST